MRPIDADEIRIKPDFIFHGVCGTPVIRCEDLARIINDMPTIEPQKWVPVSERLPKQQQTVLIQDFGEITIGYLNAENRWRDLTNLADYLKGVVAWMPLPEPYKGEET